MDNFKTVGIVLASFVVCTSAQAIDVVTTGDTTLSIGGYVKAEAVSNMPKEGESSLESSVRQSRINFKTTKMINDKKVTGLIEGDFYGQYKGFDSGNPELRLRHAYVSVDKFTVGKTWNGQFLAAYPMQNEQIDFFGTGFGTIAAATPNIRPDLVVHYASNGLRLTAQDPVYDDSNMPDLVASYTGKASNISYNVAATAREVKNGDDSDFGVGVSLGGKMAVGNGSLHASVYTGEGMGVYSALCSSTADCDAENGELVSQTGYSVGYNHNFTEKLRGNLRYGVVNVDDKAETSQKLTTANLIYKYTPEIDFGIEWRERSGDNFKPFRPEGQQVEVMAKYTF